MQSCCGSATKRKGSFEAPTLHRTPTYFESQSCSLGDTSAHLRVALIVLWRPGIQDRS